MSGGKEGGEWYPRRASAELSIFSQPLAGIGSTLRWRTLILVNSCEVFTGVHALSFPFYCYDFTSFEWLLQIKLYTIPKDEMKRENFLPLHYHYIL
jgi:hypothetical protein